MKSIIKKLKDYISYITIIYHNNYYPINQFDIPNQLPLIFLNSQFSIISLLVI